MMCGWKASDLAFYLAYVTIVLDNVLLTIVVPLVGQWSGGLETEDDDVIRTDVTSLLNATATKLASSDHSWSSLAAGSILSSRAVAQLTSAQSAGQAASARPGTVLRDGTLRVMMAALLLAGCTVMPRGPVACMTAIVGRAVQGCGSARVSVAGLTLTACPQGAGQRRVAKLLGAVALGVVLGYPLGGLSAALRVSGTALLLLAALLLADIVLQRIYLEEEEEDLECARFSPRPAAPEWSLWSIPRAAAAVPPCGAVAMAVLCTTSAVAVLEPCLPPWLHATFHPQVWVYGVVFVADSVGYLAATTLVARWTRSPHSQHADSAGLQLQDIHTNKDVNTLNKNNHKDYSKQRSIEELKQSKNDRKDSKPKLNKEQCSQRAKPEDKTKQLDIQQPELQSQDGSNRKGLKKVVDDLKAVFYKCIGNVRSVEQTAVTAQLALGMAAMALPHAATVWWLAIPQLIIGAGVGALDAALVPALLARAAQHGGGSETDRESLVPHTAALLNASSAAAYIIGPLCGSMVSSMFGFPTAMSLLGAVNLAHALWLQAALHTAPLTQYCDEFPSPDGALRLGEYLQLP